MTADGLFPYGCFPDEFLISRLIKILYTDRLRARARGGRTSRYLRRYVIEYIIVSGVVLIIFIGGNDVYNIEFNDRFPPQ